MSARPRAYDFLMTLPSRTDRNVGDIAYWKGTGGQRWLAHQRLHDALLAPVTAVLLDRAAARVGEAVLDIGCGSGAISIALAQRVAPSGRVLAVDVYPPLLERARELAPPGLPLQFALGDAATYPFEPGGAELLCSRFGVMFFADPDAAFGNMRAALRSGARLVFACWREPRQNPWQMLPLQEAYRHVARLPETGPEDPGPYSFASEQRVRRILERAGFSAIALEPIDLSIDLAEGEGLDRAVETALGIGPASRAIDGQPPAVRVAVAESIRAALAKYQKGNRVPLPGAIWVVSARNP